MSDPNAGSAGSHSGSLRDPIVHEVAKEALMAALDTSRKQGATCGELIYALIIIAADIFVCVGDNDNSVFLDTAKHTLERMREIKRVLKETGVSAEEATNTLKDLIQATKRANLN